MLFASNRLADNHNRPSKGKAAAKPVSSKSKTRQDSDEISDEDVIEKCVHNFFPFEQISDDL